MTEKNQNTADAMFDQQYDGDPAIIVGWDDMQGSVSTAVLHPQDTPVWDDYDYGIPLGVEFKALGFSVDNTIYGTIQTPHSMKLNTTLHPHLHISTPSDGDGSYIRIRMDVIACGVSVNGSHSYSAPAGSPFIVEHSIVTGMRTGQSVIELGVIPAANPTVSTLYKFKLSRIATVEVDHDEYTYPVYIDFMDVHLRKDQERGSREEYTK